MTRPNEQQIGIMKDELAVDLADWLMETYDYTLKKVQFINFL